MRENSRPAALSGPFAYPMAAWMARLNIRLSAVNSRLISAFETPVIVRRCSGTCRGVPSRAVNVNAFRSTVVAFCRESMYSRMSAVVIAAIRRLPRNGFRCSSIRRWTSSSERFRLVR